MTKMLPACAGATAALIVGALLNTAPVAAQGQAQPRQQGGGGGGGGAATPHSGQGPSGGGGGGTATASGGGQSSGGGGATGGTYSGGGRSDGGSRRDGATGGSGYAAPRDRGERTSARPNSGTGGGTAATGAERGASGSGERDRGGRRDAGGARTGNAEGSGGGGTGVPEYARPLDGRTPVGTAAPRGSVPMNPPTGGGGIYVPGGYYGGGYGYYDPWGYGYGGYPGAGGFGGYYGGYYDPWYGGYPAYPQASYSDSSDEGSLKLKLKPRDAEVYVDGYFVGIVDDFDGIFQRLHLDSGPHRIEVRAQGYEPLAFDVRITSEHTTTYQGELKKIQ